MKISNVVIDTPIEESGFYTVFGHPVIAKLCQTVQSTTIRNGNELQKLIEDEVAAAGVQVLATSVGLDELLRLISAGESFYVPGWSLPAALLESAGVRLKGKKKIAVDALFNGPGGFDVMEYKQGQALDTKKSQSEVESLDKVKAFFAAHGVDATPRLVLWSCSDLASSSIKTTESREYLMTGRGLSELLGTSFDAVELIRQQDQADNVSHFFETVLDAVPDELLRQAFQKRFG